MSGTHGTGHALLCKCSICVGGLIQPDMSNWAPRRRVRSLASYIGKLTKNNREVARFMASVMRDENQHMAHRMEAGKWLVDRSEGKAVERSVMLKIESDPGQLRIASSLPDDALAELIRGLAAPRAMPALTTTGNTPVRWRADEEGVSGPGPNPGPSGQPPEAELTTGNDEGIAEEFVEVLGQAAGEEEGGMTGFELGSHPARGGPESETKEDERPTGPSVSQPPPGLNPETNE